MQGCSLSHSCLTDLGPDDGGTVVVAGSHKVDLPAQQLIEVAYADRSLIHQVAAPAGSTLLFAETLIYATGQIRSNNERVILITGYGSTLFPYWDNGILSEEFENTIPEHRRTLFKGKVHWTRNPRYRALDEPVDGREFSLGRWNDRMRLPGAGGRAGSYDAEDFVRIALKKSDWELRMAKKRRKKSTLGIRRPR